MKKLLCALLITICMLPLVACGSGNSASDAAKETDTPPAEEQGISDELTDAEWENVQKVFTEKIGKEIEYRPSYCGEWRNGKQYKTENYAYGQFLIDMDTDGYVHLVVWVENGERSVMYNRLEDEEAPGFETPDDNTIHIVDGELGEYGKNVTIPSETFGEYTYTQYMIPAGTYEVENVGNRGTIFVVGNSNSEDVRNTVWLNETEERVTIIVDEDAHIEISVGTRIALELVD